MNENIMMIRGDTYAKAIQIEFDEAPQDLETAYLTCKSNYDDETPVFQKSLNDGIEKIKTEGNSLFYGIRIAPEDTEGIEAGNYYYDLEIGLNGDKFTLLNGILMIKNDVTREGGN